MTAHVLAGSALIAFAAAGASFVLSAPPKAAATAPTVVELYQSQGCSDCPPAIAMLNTLADRPDVLALDFAVTYWDSLGWKDTFAEPSFTQRQWDYARANSQGNVATPQFVVNGRSIIGGANGTQLAAAMAMTKPSSPAIKVDGRSVVVGEGPSGSQATVWLVRFDPRVRQVSIGRGENGGRTIPHRNIVTALRAVGTWDGRPFRFEQPAYRDSGERSAVLVQQGKGGPILAARSI